MGQRLHRDEDELPQPKRKSKKKESQIEPAGPVKKVEVAKGTWIELPANITPEKEAERVNRWRETHGVIKNDRGFHKNLI